MSGIVTARGGDQNHSCLAKTVAIIGGGHNGLTCAAYLSKAGFAVSVFEKRETLGGLCVTETPFETARDISLSSVASYFGMLRAEVVSELGLEEFGLKPYLTNPIEIVLLDHGQYVFTPRDGGEAKTKVNALNEKDMDGWIRFWQDIQKAAAIVYPHYLKPGLTQAALSDLLKEAGLDTLVEYVFDGSLFALLDRYLSNDNLKAVAATCTPGFASNAGSVFGCIHHGTASTCGEFGAWGQVFGGMGQITNALMDVALQNDARLFVDRAVQSLEVTDDKVTGIKFEDGETEEFDIVICALDPYTLFEKLLPVQAAWQGIKQHLSEHRPKVSAAKLHFLLKQLPKFSTLAAIGHNHKGVIVIAPSVEAVRKAAEDVPAGKMPEQLMLTMAFPTLEDPSLIEANGDQDKGPDRRHVLTVDVHYLPATLEGRPWAEADDKLLAEAVVKAIESQCKDFRDCIDDTFVVSPRLLKERYNLASLSCWHLPMTSEYLFEKRSLPGCKHYETPVSNLFICSAGTYPGGNVTAAPGHNLAKILIERYGHESSGSQKLPAQTASR